MAKFVSSSQRKQVMQKFYRSQNLKGLLSYKITVFTKDGESILKHVILKARDLDQVTYMASKIYPSNPFGIGKSVGQ